MSSVAFFKISYSLVAEDLPDKGDASQNDGRERE